MPSTNDTKTVTMHGMEIEVTHLEDRPGGGARLDIEVDDGRRWRVVCDGFDIDHIEMTWRDGEPADLDRPSWLDDAIARLVPA